MITIIILLILAGITISLLTETELFEKVKLSEEETKIKNVEEIIKLIILENKISENNENQKDYLENNQLIEKIASKLKNEGYSVKEDNNTVIVGKTQINISDYLEEKESHKVTINAPQNSITTFKINGKEIGKIQLSNEHNKEDINLYKEVGQIVNAECTLNQEIIYEKTFELKDNTTINMYPCEENGDGKALYWYGMEFSEFEYGAVKYGDSPLAIVGTCNKGYNNINLYFNDTYYRDAVGIGIYCKENLTNYDSIKIDAKALSYSGFIIARYFVGDVGNNYYYIDNGCDVYEEIDLITSIKNINIENIQGDKYISIVNYNPSGGNYAAYGSASIDIASIVLE